MSDPFEIQRLSTGVPGLDAILGGGLPEFSFNVVAGPPGCGKTTLAHQMMFALATPERPALYFTVLGEPPLKMLRYQQQFTFFDATAVQRSIHFINLSAEAMTGDLDLVLNRIVDEVTARSPGLVFVDSFRSVVLATAGAAGSLLESQHGRLQQFVQQLGMLMTSWQATTFLIGEYFTETDPNPVFTVSDGLIWLRQSIERNSMVRKIEVMKMRGQPTLPGLHTFRIGKAGVQVFAPIDLNVAATPVAPAHPGAGGDPALDAPLVRLKTGVAGLDDMLGGGLPQGYSLLVAGPSGSGKSRLASAFLAEGARCGEAGVLAAFEQGPQASRDVNLVKLIDAGQVGLVTCRTPDLSIDEVVLLILTEVRKRQAKRVVIDSLTGFELALPPTFRVDFRESLLRLVGALAAEGVTLLLTSELEDRYTDLRFSPYGAAFLTDAIVVQRYIEIESRLQRVMAVIKVRASAHSDELRQYSIDDTGLQVGERLHGWEGLLGGRPMRSLSASTGRPASPDGNAIGA